MHESFVSPTPSGPGNSGAFYFSIFKALLKTLHCGAKFVVKSLLNAPAHLFPSPMVVSHEKLQLAQWFQRIYEYIMQSITQKFKMYRLKTSLVDIYRWGEVQCTRYPSLVLVQPRKTRPYITERLLMGRKELNQTNKQTVYKNHTSVSHNLGVIALCYFS